MRSCGTLPNRPAPLSRPSIQRVNQLELLRNEQAASVRKSRTALAEEAREFESAQERSERAFVNADREVLHLTESLQEALRAQTMSEHRCQSSQKRLEVVSEEEALASTNCSLLDFDTNKAAAESSECEAMAATEQAEKEELLCALQVQRSRFADLEHAWSEASEHRVLLGARLEGLKQKARRALQSESALHEGLPRQSSRRLRAAFSRFLASTEAARDWRRRRESLRRSLLQSFLQSLRVVLQVWRRHVLHWRISSRKQKTGPWALLRSVMAAWRLEATAMHLDRGLCCALLGSWHEFAVASAWLGRLVQIGRRGVHRRLAFRMCRHWQVITRRRSRLLTISRVQQHHLDKDRIAAVWSQWASVHVKCSTSANCDGGELSAELQSEFLTAHRAEPAEDLGGAIDSPVRLRVKFETIEAAIENIRSQAADAQKPECESLL